MRGKLPTACPSSVTWSIFVKDFSALDKYYMPLWLTTGDPQSVLRDASQANSVSYSKFLSPGRKEKSHFPDPGQCLQGCDTKPEVILNTKSGLEKHNWFRKMPLVFTTQLYGFTFLFQMLL